MHARVCQQRDHLQRLRELQPLRRRERARERDKGLAAQHCNAPRTP